jgi:hypothetical protein
MKSLRIAALALLGSSSLLLHAGTPVAAPTLAREIISQQEGYLSAIRPRPTGADLIAASSHCEELERRINLLIENWPAVLEGRKAAETLEKDSRYFVFLSDPNDGEKAYLNYLATTYNVSAKPVESLCQGSNNHRKFFCYGFNSAIGDALAREHGLKSVDYLAAGFQIPTRMALYSPILVPWIFTETDLHFISAR